MKKLISLILCLSLMAGLLALPVLAAEEAWVSDPDYGDPDLCCPPMDSELDPELLPGLITDAAPEDGESSADAPTDAETAEKPADADKTEAPAGAETTGAEPAGAEPAGTETTGAEDKTDTAGVTEEPEPSFVKDLDPIQIMLADAPADPEVTEGMIEDTKIAWSVDRETGMLTVTGAGEIPVFREPDKADPQPDLPPWYDCRAIITGITVAEGITAIGDYAFARLPLAASLTLPESLSAIGAHAFYYDLSLTGIVLPDNVAEIGDSAFANCQALTSVKFSKNLKTIGDFAFDTTLDLAAIQLPEGLETIGDFAFYWNGKVTELTIPGSVKSWGEGAFALFEALTTVTVGEGVTAVPRGAFQNCSALETLNLPATVETLGHNFVLLSSDSPNRARMSAINVAEREGYTFDGWEDDDGKSFTSSNIVKGQAFAGDLHAQWSRTYTDDTFTDVAASDWFAPYVEACYAAELMNGMTETLFSPNTSATRAQVVTVLWRLAGTPEAEKAAPFSDVKESDWFADALAWAAEDEIANGYPDGTFLPNNSISRQEFLTLLYRFAMKLKTGPKAFGSGELDAFEDEEKVADWALDGESWSVAAKLQTGAEDNGKLYLNPTQSIRRSELAAFLARFTGAVPVEAD